MSERPFPPSPRRLALARQAGVTAASPVVVGAVACVAAMVAAVFLAGAAARLVGGWIAAACRSAADIDGARGALGLDRNVLVLDGDLLALDRASDVLVLERAVPATLELVLPLVGAAAIAALVAHVAQTRALWLPRRRVQGARAMPRARTMRSALDMVNASVIALVAFAWLWLTAPRLAQLFGADIGPLVGADAAQPVGANTLLAGVGSAIAALVVTLAIAWIALGAIDALVRRVQLAGALAMTRTEKREDDRLAAADPRWRQQRLALMRSTPASDAVARAALLLLGDDIAVAIAWDARRQPVPLRTTSGRGAHATQLLGLARRHRVPVHRDAVLAAALDGEGPVPDTHWARLAEIIAAVQARG